MTMRISRQSEYYPTEASRKQYEKGTAHRRQSHMASRHHTTPAHLVNGAGIGRLGTDPRES